MRQASIGRLMSAMIAAISMSASTMAAVPFIKTKHGARGEKPPRNYYRRQRGHYFPHQGERECARRRRQMEKAALKKPGAS